MLSIDGRKGEGGGQVLRSSLAFSALTGKAFTIQDIRGNRSRPGLRPQHLAAVRLAADLCGAEVEGAELDSNRLVFKPGPCAPGFYRVDVGTAGSVTLLAQAFLIPALACGGPVEFELVGGTDVAMAPPIDYLLEVVLPYFRRLGRIEARVEQRGFHPKGEGRVRFKLEGLKEPAEPLQLVGKPHWTQIHARVVVSEELRGAKVAERIGAGLGPQLRERAELRYVNSASTGAVATLWAVGDGGYRLGSSELGRPRLPSERLAQNALREFRHRLQAPEPIEENLADQLIPLLALTGGSLRCQEISLHCLTNMEVCGRFTGTVFEVEGDLLRASPQLDPMVWP